jgi:HSP20 family protein
MEARDLAPRNWFKRRPLPVKREENSLWGDMDRDMQRFFEDFGEFGSVGSLLSRLFKENAGSNMKVLPRVDFSETDKEYIVEAELPGVKEKDVDISISNEGVLTIQGKRETTQEQKERNYYRLERSYGSFERAIALPTDSDSDKANAEFKNGILTLHIPKKEPAAGEVKKITLGESS